MRAGRFFRTSILMLLVGYSAFGAGNSGVNVRASANPAIYGHPVTLTADLQTLFGGPGTVFPTGTVTFYDGVSVLGRVDVGTTRTTSLLPPGTDFLQAPYSVAS